MVGGSFTIRRMTITIIQNVCQDQGARSWLWTPECRPLIWTFIGKHVE